MFYTIYPLFNGHFSVGFRALRSDLPSFNDIHSFAFLLQHEDGELILVDTGFATDHIPGVNSRYKQEPEQQLHHAIAALGFDPLSISTVIQTHLHWDHTAGMYLFPNATFFIQGEEFRSFFSLHPNEETYYAPAHWLPFLSQIHLLEGNTELRPGLRLIVTGGHTAGHQVVEVQTREGLFLLGGDAPFNYDQLWKAIPPEGWQAYKEGAGKDFYWNQDILPTIDKFLMDQKHKDLPAPNLDTTLLSTYNKRRILLSHAPKLLKFRSIP